MIATNVPNDEEAAPFMENPPLFGLNIFDLDQKNKIVLKLVEIMTEFVSLAGTLLDNTDVFEKVFDYATNHNDTSGEDKAEYRKLLIGTALNGMINLSSRPGAIKDSKGLIKNIEMKLQQNKLCYSDQYKISEDNVIDLGVILFNLSGKASPECLENSEMKSTLIGDKQTDMHLRDEEGRGVDQMLLGLTRGGANDILKDDNICNLIREHCDPKNKTDQIAQLVINSDLKNMDKTQKMNYSLNGLCVLLCLSEKEIKSKLDIESVKNLDDKDMREVFKLVDKDQDGFFSRVDFR